MGPNQFIKKIRIYAFISFLLPLVTINTCLLVFKLLGSVDSYPNHDWSKKKIEYTFNEFSLIAKDYDSYSISNCPKYNYYRFYHTADQIIEDKFENGVLLRDTIADNKVKSVVLLQGTIKNDRCVKHNQFAYFLIDKFSIFEKFLMISLEENTSGFGKIKNPYFYGEASISRTARYFPATLIFKPFIILSSIFLFFYWLNSLNLFKEFKNRSILNTFSKKFFYFGLFSCFFLILHATFLGTEFESEVFKKIRRLIIILFILFELLAQIFLTRNLLKFKNNIKNYINLFVLRTKIIFITIIFSITCVVFALLAWGDLSSNMKHVIEWNYFSFLLLYYLLSVLFWKKYWS